MKPLAWIRKKIGRKAPPSPASLEEKWRSRLEKEMMQRNAKFELTEDYYLRFRCRACGLSADADTEEEGFTECECGNTDIWVTRGERWVRRHGPDAVWDGIGTTNDIMVPLQKRKWLIGQEKPVFEEHMQLTRWVDKLKKKQAALKRGDLEGAFMKENPGPFILRVSEPGTGKTMSSKIMNESAERLYKENDIELTDVLTLENRIDKTQPLVREVPCYAVQGGTCLAPRILRQAERGGYSEQKDRQQLIFSFLSIAIVIGLALLVTGLFVMGVYVMLAGLVAAWLQYMSAYIYFFTVGVTLLFIPLLLMVFMGGQMFGVSHSHTANIPHPLVIHGDGNGKNIKYVMDATTTSLATIVGSIQWSPYGDQPNLAAPAHRRVMAGIVHKQNDLIVDIDEIRNMSVQTATALLDVMENGQSIIRSYGGGNTHGNENASGILSVQTQNPVPADCMIVANGNMDLIRRPDSIFAQVPAFYDRFGYGRRIHFDTHMPATPENELKLAQAITDEIYRFRMHPMERGGIRRIVEYTRSRAENNATFRIMFRYIINALLQANNLVLVEGRNLIRTEDVERAISEFTESLQAQALHESLSLHEPFDLIRTEGVEYGLVNGLAVLAEPGTGERGAGKAFAVAAVVEPVDDPKYGVFQVTGEEKEEASWVQDSIKTVRTVVKKLYGKDIAKDYYTHISFARQKGVEGPSAGAAMTLAVMSILGDPRIKDPSQRRPVPMRLDVAMTGTIELVPDPKDPMNLRIGAIGGVPEKIQGAASAGCKYVIVPMQNHDHSLTKERYPCKVFGGETILDYFDILRADGKGRFAGLLDPPDLETWANEQAERKTRAEQQEAQ